MQDALPDYAPVPHNGRPTTSDFMSLVEFTWRVTREAHEEQMEAFHTFEEKFDARMSRLESRGAIVAGLGNFLGTNFRVLILVLLGILLLLGVIDDPGIFKQL